MKSNLRSESFKRNFSIIVFVYKLMIGCSKKNRENYLKKNFERRNKESEIKI